MDPKENKELLLEKGNREVSCVKTRDGHKSHVKCRSEAAVHPFIHLADNYLATPVCQAPWEALRLSKTERYSTWSYEAWFQMNKHTRKHSDK